MTKAVMRSTPLAIVLSIVAAPSARAQTPNAQQSPPPAQADSASTPTSDADIVVTAQRRSERLQDVPISISALGQTALAQRGVTDVSGLTGVVPGLTISTFGGVNASNLIAIRGISGQPLPIGAGQATAVYLDGVYLARPDSAFFALDDIERIEVLRGPQGTLYGRNATAGAINIITRQPGDRTAGSFDISYGNFGTVKARGSVSLPLGAGFSAGLSAAYDHHDNYFVNSVDNQRLGDNHSSTLRGKLRYDAPGGAFDATLSADTSRRTAVEPYKNVLAGGISVGIGDPSRIASDIPDRIRAQTRSQGISFVANVHAASNLQLTSVTGYRDFHSLTFYDGDGSSAPIFLTGGDTTSKSFNQEVRGVYTGHRIRATLGANYFHETGTFGLSALSPALPPSLTSPYDTTKLDAYAAFGQLEFDLTDRLTLVGGLRYNREKRDFTIDYRQAKPVAGNFLAGKISDNAVLPSVGVNFKAAPDILLYAKASKGYQAPGFNFAPGVVAPANTFAAETLWDYEAGAKMQFWDRRVTLNVAGFYYDYRNIQVRSVIAPGVTVVNNAASAKVKGAEAELTIRPIIGLTLSAQATYLDATYGRFCETISAGTPLGSDPLCSSGVADRTGNRLSATPKWNGALSANYEAALGGGTSLNLNASYAFQSGLFFTTTNEVGASNDGWNRLDARVGLTLPGNLEVYAFGRNLTDNRYVGQAYRLSAAVLIASINDPRTYGVGMRYRF